MAGGKQSFVRLLHGRTDGLRRGAVSAQMRGVLPLPFDRDHVGPVRSHDHLIHASKTGLTALSTQAAAHSPALFDMGFSAASRDLDYHTAHFLDLYSVRCVGGGCGA